MQERQGKMQVDKVECKRNKKCHHDTHTQQTVHSEDFTLPFEKVVSGLRTWQHHPRHPA